MRETVIAACYAYQVNAFIVWIYIVGSKVIAVFGANVLAYSLA